MTTDRNAMSEAKRELITFLVGDQDFCMDIRLVREIRGWTSVTPLPHSPADVLGVMNLRGAVVPIVDLSARLGLGFCRAAERNVIIIVTIGERTIGLLVTAVSDILGVLADDVQPVPEVGSAEASAFVEGILASSNRTLRILSIDVLGTNLPDESEVV